MSTNIADAVTAAVDWLPHHGFFVDAPVDAVWPFIVDWTTWVDDKRLDHVSGQRGAVGEVQRLGTVDADGVVVSSFLVETARIVPNVRLAYRILPHGSEKTHVDRSEGYAIFHLYPVGPRTLVTYETVSRMETSSLSQEEFRAATAGSEAAGQTRWNERYIPRLRMLLRDSS